MTAAGVGAGEFQAVSEAARLMSPFPGTWLVVGGWAVDLFIGQLTREHDDVDIGLARQDQVAARRLLPAWQYEKVVPRGTELAREPWPEEEWLELPVHEIHAHSPAGRHVEFLLLERRWDEWVYRRDSRVTLALHRVDHRRSEEGGPAGRRPYLAGVYERSARARLPMFAPPRIRSKRVSSGVEVLVRRLVIAWSL